MTIVRSLREDGVSKEGEGRGCAGDHGLLRDSETCLALITFIPQHNDYFCLARHLVRITQAWPQE
jgi:hypothetical protein